jgi:cytosine/adenosine deaminase-related metal-dependent hydrolase
MATLHGARALGLEDEVGSIEAGKRGDLTVVDMSGLHAGPSAEDVLAPLVHAARGSDVAHVFIDGKPVLKDGVLTTLDAPAVLSSARGHVDRILRRRQRARGS